MSKNQKFNGLALHGSHKKALKSSECWELINQLSHETGIDFDSIYVIGFKGNLQGKMIEKNYKANRNSKTAPHHSDILVWLYSASGDQKTWFREWTTGMIHLSSHEVDILLHVKEKFTEQNVDSCVRSIVDYYDVFYGYSYQQKKQGYNTGMESTYNWLTDCSSSKNAERRVFPRDPVVRWQWYLKYAAPRIGPPLPEGDLIDERPYDLRGVFRDVYTHNLLTPQHLEKQIHDKSLREHLSLGTEWGSLSTITEGQLYLWTLTENQISKVRLAMEHANLLVACTKAPAVWGL
jgi:hypothetical protein